jgi:preprotein translocase subunit SecG
MVGNRMTLIIVFIHVVVCIALIMIVLLQTGKGADMGAAFGGGASQTLFGTSGASTVLTKMTTGAAIIFMLTSLTLAYIKGQRRESTILSSPPAVTEQKAPEVTSGTQNTPSAPAEAPKEAPKQ